MSGSSLDSRGGFVGDLFLLFTERMLNVELSYYQTLLALALWPQSAETSRVRFVPAVQPSLLRYSRSFSPSLKVVGIRII